MSTAARDQSILINEHVRQSIYGNKKRMKRVNSFDHHRYDNDLKWQERSKCLTLYLLLNNNCNMFSNSQSVNQSSFGKKNHQDMG